VCTIFLSSLGPGCVTIVRGELGSDLPMPFIAVILACSYVFIHECMGVRI